MITVSPFFGESLPLPGERIVFVKPISSVRFFLFFSFGLRFFRGMEIGESNGGTEKMG
jgi:hypothetical protein